MRGEVTALRELLRPADAQPNEEALPLPPKVRFQSGRTLRLAESSDSDTVTVTSPDGMIEMSVRFTPAGPVLSFGGARVELTHASELSVDCERLTLRGRQAVEVRSGGELVLRGNGDVAVDGENVLINCADRAEFAR